jgi:phenylalanyl-tRNA synthetase beta chain
VKGEQVIVKAPPHRMDIGEGIVGKADVIEEVARLYGYENIPSLIIASELPPQRSNPLEERNQFFQDTLVSMGLQEVISYRFTNPEQENRIYPPDAKPQNEAYVELLNPIAVEKRVLRRSLLSSVLEALEHNMRLRDRLALFEIGPVFIPNDQQQLPDQPYRLAIAMSGLRHPRAWDQKNDEKLDFYDLKGVIDALLSALHLEDVVFEPIAHPTFHPGKCARLSVSGEVIGWLGELHPLVAENYDFGDSSVVAADLDMEKLYQLSPKNFTASQITAYPP